MPLPSMDVRPGHLWANIARSRYLVVGSVSNAGATICGAMPDAVDVGTGGQFALSRGRPQARHHILIANAAPPRLDKAVNPEQEEPGRNKRVECSMLRESR